MELMRHECIDTTLKHYVGRNAQRTSKILKEADEKLESPPGAKDEGPRDTSRDTTPPAGGEIENRNC